MSDISISHDPINGPKKQTLKEKNLKTAKQWEQIMNNIDGLSKAVNKKTQPINEMEFATKTNSKEAETNTIHASMDNKTDIDIQNHEQLETQPVQNNSAAVDEKMVNTKDNKKNNFSHKTIEITKKKEAEVLADISKVNLKNVGIPSKDTFFVSGEYKTRTFKVDDLHWSRNNEEWNKKFRLTDTSVSSIEVKNKRNKSIAHFVNGHYYVKDKRVTEEKFQKYVHSKGETMTITYKPDIEPVCQKPELKITKFEIPKKIQNLLLPQPIPPSEQVTCKSKITREIETEVYHKIKDIADRLNCDHRDLMAVINAESGFNPKARNKYSGATGLIQFMPKTAKGLGTTIDELKNMSTLEQLDYVEQYLQSVKKSVFKNNEQLSGADLYALIFLPKNAKKEALAHKGHAYYDLNKVLDVDGDGIISKADLEMVVKSKHINVQMV